MDAQHMALTAEADQLRAHLRDNVGMLTIACNLISGTDTGGPEGLVILAAVCGAHPELWEYIRAIIGLGLIEAAAIVDAEGA